MKSKEELNELKEKVETISSKLQELSEEELKQVTGGGDIIATGGSDYPDDVTKHLENNDSFWNGSFLFVFVGKSGDYPLSQRFNCNMYISNPYLGYYCIGSMNQEVGALNEMEYRGKFNG